MCTLFVEAQRKAAKATNLGIDCQFLVLIYCVVAQNNNFHRPTISDRWIPSVWPAITVANLLVNPMFAPLQKKTIHIKNKIQPSNNSGGCIYLLLYKVVSEIKLNSRKITQKSYCLYANILL